MAAIDVATALVDDAGTIVFANARFANRVASSKVAAHGPSLVGAKLTDVVARVEADALSVVEALKRALEPATPPEGVEWIRRPSNDPSHARALAVAVSRAPCEADAPRRRRLASVYVGDAKVPPASLPAPRLLGPPVSKVSVAKTPRSDHDVDFNYFPSDLVEDSRREPKRRRNNEAAKAPKRTQDKAPPRDAAAPKASAAPKAKREAKPRAKALSADAPEADAPPPPPTTTRGGRTVRRTTKS
ncbi:hypothetical protein M885DRAFT_551953 [Pelagophyceae sp. CCMP2097]|nr:hypothetical protein M885DRAFT_551953 [Pelagophyceae sp. CCMP2097]